MTSKRKTMNNTEDLLSKLIIERDWYQVRKKINANKAHFITWSSQSCAQSLRSGNYLLLACKYNPPLKVINSLLKVNPSGAFEFDSKKKLPLHVACECGASPAVIRKLLRANKDAVFRKDVSGMLPIHKICRSYYNSTDPWIPKENVQIAMMQIITDILVLQPNAMLEEDDDGKWPIEYALDSGLRIEVINALRERCRSQQIDPSLFNGEKTFKFLL